MLRTIDEGAGQPATSDVRTDISDIPINRNESSGFFVPVCAHKKENPA